MKNTSKKLRIVPRGVVQLHNGESAAAGEAAILVNMREREESLEVVGDPQVLSQLMPGDKVLLVDDDRTLVLRGNSVIWGDVVVLEPSGQVVAAHKIGALLVVVTSDGNIVLRRTVNGYDALYLSTAIPQMHITVAEQSTMTSAIPDYEFNTPYSTWQAPLSSADVDSLTKLMRNAVTTLQRQAMSQGRYTGVLLARYAVRLWDDSYLWMSQPVMVGHGLVSNSYRTTATVTTSGNAFTGIESCNISMISYRLGITMASGIASEWRHLIKAIDVLVTPVSSLIDLNAGLDYRCVITTSSGTRRYLLEMGPKPRPSSAMLQTLLNGDWHVAASTTMLDGSGFVAVNTAVASQQVIPGLRCDVVTSQLLAPHKVDREECARIMENCSQNAVSQVSMEHNGRLFQAPTAFSVLNPWRVLPWLDGSPTSSSATATVQVTLSTNEGDVVLTKTGVCPCSATSLNPMISFPDVRATHIAMAVGNRVWESDLAPMEGTGMAAYINPALYSNAMTTGSISSQGSSSITIPSEGTVLVSAVGNPLVTQWRSEVSGRRILALGAACRPIYSGGFGRYPIYIFTTQGIMALPQSTNGTWGEPRLITEVVLGDGAKPVAGGDALWFVSQHGILCQLSGSTLKRMLHEVATETQLAWNDHERELWVASSDGGVVVVMLSGRTFGRDIAIGNLYSDPSHALAVTADGTLLDLSHELPAVKNVSFLSHPFVIDATKRPSRITWNLFTTMTTPSTANVTLTLRGERGGSCHGYIINQVRASGVVAAPLSRPIIAPPTRTLRLQVEAAIRTGTILLPTIITN
ncbi:MAG: hypothetical protein IKW83_10965 [Muribaculaceae bacterium]|nr:hypothetical protein [Muribaculaceae bacterium]